MGSNLFLDKQGDPCFLIEIIQQEIEIIMQDDNSNNRQCKYCIADIPSGAKICPICKSNQKWYLNYFRISDVFLFASLSISLLMVIFSYLNFHEAREERVKAAVALTTANDAATKASSAVMRADDAAKRVSNAEKSVNGTVARVRKIEQSSGDVNNTIKQIQIRTSSGFKAFDSNLKDVKKDSSTLASYYNVRAGDRLALNDLIRLANHGVDRERMLAKSLLDDANLYLKDYKYNLIQQTVINFNTKKYYRVSAEKIYDGIYNDNNASMREAYINEIANRDLKYFVRDLVKIAIDDPNLKVACRAESAIEKLTEKIFEDYPPYNEVQRWWDQEGNKDKKYSNSMHRLRELPALKFEEMDKKYSNSPFYLREISSKFGDKEFDNNVALLTEIIDSQQGMCFSHARIAELFFTKDISDKEAKEHFKIAIEQCDDVLFAQIRYASILYKEGKKNEAIQILSKSKQYVVDVTFFKELCLSLFPEVIEDEGFKKILSDK
jgi:hypothetical protein